MSVTGRPRPCARRAGSDLQHSAFVDPADAAPARADVRNVDAGQTDRQPVHFRLGGNAGYPVRNEADVRARSADVQRNDVAITNDARHPRRPDHSGGRPRIEHLHAPAMRSGAREHTAGRLHHEQSTSGRAIAEMPLKAAQVTTDQRHQIGCHHRRRRPLVFAESRQHVRRQHHGQIRIAFVHDPSHRLLVLGIPIGVQQADRKRFGLFLLDQLVDRPTQFVFVERERLAQRHPCARSLRRSA